MGEVEECQSGWSLIHTGGHRNGRHREDFRRDACRLHQLY